MSFEVAIRLTEVLVGFAFVQQSIEHLASFGNERRLFAPRLLLAILVIIGFLVGSFIGTFADRIDTTRRDNTKKELDDIKTGFRA